jgi:hypothetical protein
VRNRAGFRGGGRAQVPSLPVDDPLTSDEEGVYFAYTRCINEALSKREPGRAQLYARAAQLVGRFEDLEKANVLATEHDRYLHECFR